MADGSVPTRCRFAAANRAKKVGRDWRIRTRELENKPATLPTGLRDLNSLYIHTHTHTHTHTPHTTLFISAVAVAAKGLLFFSEMLHADGWRLAADAGCGWLPANGELLAAGS